MNLDFLKNVDKKIIILAVALLILIVLMASEVAIKKNRAKLVKQESAEYQTISLINQPIIKQVRFSNIQIKQYSETNAYITATVTNTTSKPINAFTISIKRSKDLATALVPSLEPHACASFSTNVSIDLSNVTKVEANSKTFELRFQ